MSKTIQDAGRLFKYSQKKKAEFVQTFLKGGLKQKEFCNQYHLKQSTFRNWIHRYKPGKTDLNTGSMPAFSSVILRDEAAPLKEKIVKDLQIKRKDFIVTVPVGFDPKTLSQIIHILQVAA